MTNKQFLVYLAALSAGMIALLLAATSVVPALAQHRDFGLATVALFALICLGLFFAGSAAAKSSNKFAFTNLISLSVFGKMAAAIAFLFAYQKLAHPKNNLFVAVFLLSYVVYTAFEVWFMRILAKMK